ncbi:hypothetical protein Bbelb_399300 [Branchiostoma belcheri]|nr:hypothetical protein Bbelb_399300 [Branchiostoma belcheri]
MPSRWQGSTGKEGSDRSLEFELAGLTSAQTFCQQAVEHVQTRVETLLTKEVDLESDWSEFYKTVKASMKNPSAKKVPTQVQMKSEGLWEISYTPRLRGNPVFTIGRKCSGVGEVSLPLGVAVDKDGNIAVSEGTRDFRSLIGTQPDGSLIWDIGKWKLQVPVFMSVDESRDVMFVTDKTAHKVFAFDLDPEGNIIVGNGGDGRVQVFAPDRTFKQKVGTVKEGYAT